MHLRPSVSCVCVCVCVCVQGGVERVKLCVSECIGGYRAIACMHTIHTDRI